MRFLDFTPDGELDDELEELLREVRPRRKVPGKRPRTQALIPYQLAARVASQTGGRAPSAPSVGAAAGSSGAPLPAALQARMEDAFAFDFGAVRVHEGREAAGVGAVAFARGNDLYFAPGEYAPETARGQELLGHELAHVVQQAEGRVATTLQHAGVDVNDDASLEHEADAWGRRAAQGVAVGRSGGASRYAGTGREAVQRQGPNPPATPPPAGVTSLNFLPVQSRSAGSDWGVTDPDAAVFDITAYSDGTAWKCVLTKADQQTRQGFQLLPGVVEVTDAMVQAETSVAKLDTMALSLKTVADQGDPSGYYMIAAVRAHEAVHLANHQRGIAAAFPALRSAVEALTVAFAGNADAAAAATAIKALPAYNRAMSTFNAAELSVATANTSHSPMTPYTSAEHAVVDPMIAKINARKAALAPRRP